MSAHTIGEVLNRLKGEFDDITISKIRFLEAEGLIQPDRTESGYRQFSEEDVDRLRYVLRAQRDRYLPLKVIKDELDRRDSGEAPAEPEDAGSPAAAPAPTEPPGAPLLAVPATDVQLNAVELADAAGLDIRDIRALVDHGVLPDNERFDGEVLRATRVAAELLQAGLEPRHLRMFAQFADRHTALTEQLVNPLLRQRNPDARRRAQDQAEHLADRGLALQRVLLGIQLRQLLRP